MYTANLKIVRHSLWCSLWYFFVTRAKLAVTCPEFVGIWLVPCVRQFFIPIMPLRQHGTVPAWTECCPRMHLMLSIIFLLIFQREINIISMKSQIVSVDGMEADWGRAAGRQEERGRCLVEEERADAELEEEERARGR